MVHKITTAETVDAGVHISRSRGEGSRKSAIINVTGALNSWPRPTGITPSPLSLIDSDIIPTFLCQTVCWSWFRFLKLIAKLLVEYVSRFFNNTLHHYRHSNSTLFLVSSPWPISRARGRGSLPYVSLHIVLLKSRSRREVKTALQSLLLCSGMDWRFLPLTQCMLA